ISYLEFEIDFFFSQSTLSTTPDFESGPTNDEADMLRRELSRRTLINKIMV
ncbi:hypothetical protein L9F63_000068, partial [Diploptera punctata]